MKNIKSALYLIYFASIGLFSQSFRFLSDAVNNNYEKIVRTNDSILNLFSDTGIYLKEKKRYQRWKYFWDTRVDSNNINGGSLSLWANSIKSYLNGNQICTQNGNWGLIGPGKSYHALQELGIVVSCEVNPDDNSNVFLGTNASGLWVTYDANSVNPSWANLTDQLRLPALGVNDILLIKNPINPNKPTIIIGIGIGGILYKKYGIGKPILKSTDGGITWSAATLNYTVNNKLVCYKLFKCYDNNNNLILYAGIDDMLFKSNDLGNTWNLVYTLPPYDPSSNPSIFELPRKIVDIECHPLNSNLIYLSTDNRLIKDNPLIIVSTDGFTTNNKIYEVKLPYTNTNVILPPTYYSNVIEHERIELSVTKSNPNNLYLAFDHHNGYDVVLKGSLINFDSINHKVDLIIDKIYPFYSFGSASGANYWNVELSISDSTDKIIFACGTQVYSIENTPLENWKETSDYSPTLTGLGGHADIRAFKIYDIKSDYDPISLLKTFTISVIMGNDGGASVKDFIFEVTASGNSTLLNLHSPWKNITTKLPITQFYEIDVAQNTKDIIIGGTQDNGSFLLYEDNNVSFLEKIGGCDGGTCTFLNENSEKYTFLYTQYCGSYADITIKKFDISTLNFTNAPVSAPYINVSSPIYLGSNPIVPINKMKSYNYINQFYNFGFTTGLRINKPNHLYPFKDLQLHVTPSTLTPSGGTLISSIDVNETDTNQVIVTFFNPTYSTLCPYRKILISNNIFSTTTTWTDLTQNVCNTLGYYPFAWAPITKVISKPSDPKTFWVTFGAFTTSKVIKTTDGGNSWSDLSNGLPNFPINDIIYEKGSNDGLYVATDVGVFYTNNEIYPSQGWVCFNQGLPVCIVTDLEINYKQNKIYAATFGRGVWKSDLFCPSDYDLSYSSPAANLNNTFKEAQNNILITTTSGLWSVQDFTARAGNEISISAQPGAEFVLNTNSRLFIHPCNSPGNSFRTNYAGGQSQTSSPPFTKPFMNKNASKQQFYTVKLFPNPFNDEITVESSIDIHNYEIYNSQGKKVLEGTLSHSRNIQTTSLKSGIYLIRIIDNRSQPYTFKMIKP